MQDAPPSRSTLVLTFLATWEFFPEPVSLLERNRSIVAANALGRKFGMVQGAKCHSLNPEAQGNSCRQCRANEALDKRQAVISKAQFQGQEIESYWIPLPDSDDYYIHFGIGVRAIAEQMAGK
ncbi:hypothetical protein [Holophaga foetida]|uniref:hypothetical protein n=1 Tax=Holophaga foetida TaxID=35839 RepID=UPI0002475377|nr:hypothetical protein [Holophaga foetida]